MANELYEVLVKDPALREVFRELGRRMSLGHPTSGLKAGNFDAKYLTVAFTVADTEHEILHALGRTPVGLMLVANVQAPAGALGVRVEPTKAATDRSLFLKASEATTLTFLIW